MPSPTLGDAFKSDVDPATLDAAWKGIGARRVRARRMRRAMMASPLVVGLALVLFLFLRRATPLTTDPHVIALANGAALPQLWSGASTSTVALDDGSHIELDSNARIHPIGTLRDPTRVDLALEAGSTTFDIKPGGPRAWMIEAGETRVRVLGTRFTVLRDGEHVHVEVARGKVRVESARIPGGSKDLVAGDAIDVDARSAAASHSNQEGEKLAPSPAPTPVLPVEKLADAPAVPSGMTQPQAPAPEKPRHEAQPDEPHPGADVPSTPKPVDRMAQADAARKAGQPREAIAILTSVVDHQEPGAALAAFTIGKVHSEELADPASGATWFERAIRLGLPVALDEDAHARVVDCLGRARRADDASAAAKRYEAKFPTGRHLGRVRRWIKE